MTIARIERLVLSKGISGEAVCPEDGRRGPVNPFCGFGEPLSPKRYVRPTPFVGEASPSPRERCCLPPRYIAIQIKICGRRFEANAGRAVKGEHS